MLWLFLWAVVVVGFIAFFAGGTGGDDDEY